MIQVLNKLECCGCTACANICPNQCIRMDADFEGFLYPSVDRTGCMNCHLCENVCPVKNPLKETSYVRKAYAIRTRNLSTLYESTSGGLFTPLASLVLEEGGVLCTACYDATFRVKHMFIGYPINNCAHVGGVEKARGSKYVQSDLGECYKQIKQLLKLQTKVCFVGTTCQVYGLKSFLQKDYSNLVTVDLVCHGVPSPLLWNKYLDYQTQRYSSRICAISFRSKLFGYHSGGLMKIDFKNGKQYFASARVDYMLKCFFEGLSSRPICFQCPFKKINRCSDLTVYDCWHFSELTHCVDDDNGYTNVIVQSVMGKEVIDKLKNKIDMYSVDLDRAVELDGIMVKRSAEKNPKRDTFYEGIHKNTLSEHIDKYISITSKDYMIEKIKISLYRSGLLQKIRNCKKR